MFAIVALASVLAWADGRLKLPDLRGKTVAEANALLKQAGFLFDVSARPDGDCDGSDAKRGNDKIRCQDPGAGTLADKHVLVRVGVQHDFDESDMIRANELAALIGLTLDQAKQKLHALGHRGDLEVEPYVDGQPCKPGVVCKVMPEATIYKDGQIVLFVGK